MKIPAAKAAVDKEWEKLAKIPAWDLTKSEVNQRWSMKQGRRAQKFTLPHWWTSVIWRMPNWRQSTKKQRSSCIPRRHCERWFWFLCSIHWTSISITNDSSKGHGYHIQTARVLRRSSWRSICLYPGKNGRCFKDIENSQNRSVQTFGFVYHDTNGLNHGPVWKTQSFLLSEICVVILWKDCYEKGNLRKSYWSTVGRRFPIGNAHSCTVKKGYSYQCMRMTSNWLEGTKILIRCGKYSNQEVDLGEPSSFLDHV